MNNQSSVGQKGDGDWPKAPKAFFMGSLFWIAVLLVGALLWFKPSSDISVWLLLSLLVIVLGGEAVYEGLNALSRWWDKMDENKPPLFPNIFSLMRLSGLRISVEIVTLYSLIAYYLTGLKGVLITLLIIPCSLVLAIFGLIAIMASCRCSQKQSPE